MDWILGSGLRFGRLVVALGLLAYVRQLITDTLPAAYFIAR